MSWASEEWEYAKKSAIQRESNFVVSVLNSDSKTSKIRYYYVLRAWGGFFLTLPLIKAGLDSTGVDDGGSNGGEFGGVDT